MGDRGTSSSTNIVECLRTVRCVYCMALIGPFKYACEDFRGQHFNSAAAMGINCPFMG